MTLNDFGKTIEFNIEHNLKYAVLGLGAPGVGKSQLIRQIGKKYGYKVIDLRLAQMSEVEIGGLIYPNESRTKTVWLAPEVLPNEERDGANTILLLDEITSCSKRVQVAAYQLILDRRIGQYTLPEGCFVIALGNREDDDGVYIQLAGPLADRFEIHYIEPDFQSWKNDFAIPTGVHRYVIDYLSFKPSALHTQAQEGEGAMIFATPRSWDRVSDILKYCDDVSNPVIYSKIIGNIGSREGNQFVEFCEKQSKMVSADDYIYGKKAAPKKPEEVSVLVNSMIRKCDFLKNVEHASALSAQDRALVEDVVKALVKLPQAEYAVVGLKGILEINREPAREICCELDDEDLSKFINNNSFALGLSGDKKAGVKEKKSWMSLWN
ncbi:MAG: MoxR family ATPase [Lachnospiraceae bacterium]|nr:MoxR family ATPase [Lachnospiraceae bacterium]